MLREFEKPETSNGFTCPLCRTSDERLVVLIPIPGTEDGGGIVEAQQAHADCLRSLVGWAVREMVG